MSKKKKDEREWTEERIQNLILKNNKMVEHCLLVLYSRQTRTERCAQSANTQNKMGFNKIDAKFLTSLAEWINKSTYVDGCRLTPKQRAAARKRLKKYVKQLTTYANARKEVEVQRALGCTNYSSELHKDGGTFDDR